LEDAELKELLRLLRFYNREAGKCEAGKAFLAGCIMLGAVLETMLILVIHCYADDVLGCSGLPRKKGQVKPLLDWKLIELLRVAKELGWLPSRLRLDEAWNARQAQIGDYAEALRQLRNVVHPGGYLEELRGRRMTQQYLAGSFHILEAARQHLLEVLNASLYKAMLDGKDT
jgi:hypothetical protein